MKTERITPATVDFRFGKSGGSADASKANSGAGCEDRCDTAAELFLGGNGLPGRWRSKDRFVILETGFGLGHRFLSTWAAWRADPERCGRLSFICIEAHPPSVTDLKQAHTEGRNAALVEALSPQWPGPIAGLHLVSLDADRVRLLLAWGDRKAWLPEITATVDAFFLGGLVPDPGGEAELARLVNHCARLGAADATAAGWAAAGNLKEALRTAGYADSSATEPGPAGGLLSARRLPRAHSGPKAQAPEGRRSAPRYKTALVIGAGLAGAAAARALAARGVVVTVLERSAHAASAASGNVAGLFHGVVHAADGVHARILRAAALHAQNEYMLLFEQGLVTGACCGLLRGTRADDVEPLVGAGAREPIEVATMRALLNSQGLPPRYAEALDASAASALAGVELSGPWWHFPGGGWLAPRELVATWLAGPGITSRFANGVAAIEPQANGGWRAVSGSGQSLAEAEVMVVASAGDSVALLSPWTDAALWPLQDRRGQVTQLSDTLMAALHLAAPLLPVANAGYAIGLPARLGGGMVCGATSHAADSCAALRIEDHLANLAHAEIGRGAPAPRPTPERRTGLLERHATGRVGWRQVSADRLPVVGPVPVSGLDRLNARKLDQPRHVPRVEGLYTLCALGSRGITLAPLLGQVLAAWITGEPQPVGADLLDVMDPARFLSKRMRRTGNAV